jgi:hypothetical protein
MRPRLDLASLALILGFGAHDLVSIRPASSSSSLITSARAAASSSSSLAASLAIVLGSGTHGLALALILDPAGLALVLDPASLILVLSPWRAWRPLPHLRRMPSPLSSAPAHVASSSSSSPADLDLVLVSNMCGSSIALVFTSAFVFGLDIVSTGTFVSGLALAATTRYSTSIASPHPFLLCETER